MKRKKPLSETNPYLKDPAVRQKLAEQSVRSSSEVEGIEIDYRKIIDIHFKRSRKSN